MSTGTLVAATRSSEDIRQDIQNHTVTGAYKDLLRLQSLYRFFCRANSTIHKLVKPLRCRAATKCSDTDIRSE